METLSLAGHLMTARYRRNAGARGSVELRKKKRPIGRMVDLVRGLSRALSHDDRLAYVQNVAIHARSDTRALRCIGY